VTEIVTVLQEGVLRMDTEELREQLLTEVCAGAFSGLGAMILDEDRICKADEEELKEIAAQYGIR